MCLSQDLKQTERTANQSAVPCAAVGSKEARSGLIELCPCCGELVVREKPCIESDTNSHWPGGFACGTCKWVEVDKEYDDERI